MTGMDWILCISTPVRSGHQRALTKAFCNKRGERQRYWLGWTLVNLFLSPFFSIFFFICLSFHYYSPSLSDCLICLYLPLRMLSPSPHAFPIHPLSLSNHLFIADLFILYSFSLGTVHAVYDGVSLSRTHGAVIIIPLHPFQTLFLPPHQRRDTWGRAGSHWSNLRPYWFH